MTNGETTAGGVLYILALAGCEARRFLLLETCFSVLWIGHLGLFCINECIN